MPKKNYVDSVILEEWWYGWTLTGDDRNWDEMGNLIYKICEGVAIKFHPKTDDDRLEHIHDACMQTLEKIRTGRLIFIHGKAPVFNLLTTTIFRILYSKMNRNKKQKEHMRRYTYDKVQKLNPEILHMVDCPYED